MIDVSIVIVCMNNLKNLYPCLESIKKYTTVSYECFVVAYLFTKENMEKVKTDFPWVEFVESNEIRGFSENNNLALRQAKGKYCFVVNDDTEMKMPVIDRLIESFGKCPKNTAVVSPNILNYKGEVAVCGRPKITLWKFVLKTFHLWDEKSDTKYINKTGLFQTYNILGAAFLMKTDVFRNHGWFDEYYFFCPEDIALSTDLNNDGYLCFVDSDTYITHYEGMSNKSISYIQTATWPASRQGCIHFYANNRKCIELFLRFITIVGVGLNYLLHVMKGRLSARPNSYIVMAIGDLNTLKTAFSRKKPKELFIEFYNKIKK